MRIDTTTLYPWADVNNMLGRMRRLRVMVGNAVHEGEADMSLAEDGTLVLAFDAPVAKAAKKGHK